MTLSTEWFALVKGIHLITIIISLGGFCLRWILVMHDHPIMTRRWVRVIPHINDTILLMAAIALTLMIHQYPLAHHWLTAKIVGLVAYVLFGAMALRGGKTKRIKTLYFIAAVASFMFIVGAALNHSPWSWLILLKQ